MYLDRNFYRDPESIFAHLVEVVGGLSLVASGKKKARVIPEEFLAKSLGWWMALCGKVGVKSIEALVWTKFPYACPYCREAHHVPAKCKSARQQRTSPDWEKLAEMGKDNAAKKPSALPGWQKMYDVIYPRSDSTSHEKNFSRLAEELGELAEGIRVLPIARTYFLSEAADVFAWLMGEANQMDSEKSYPGGHGAFLENAMNTEYPGKCKYCGSQLCKCPPVLQSTLGRLAHETPSTAFPGSAGDMLFTVEEAREFFRVGDEEIRLAGKELSVNSELIREVLAMVRPLQKLIMEQTEIQRGVQANLALSLKGVEQLATQQRLTQESVDDLVAAINSLPSERRSVVIDFLTGISSGAFLPLLLHALGV
jgi:NTP pyrophosphatase (non-canonical NTP hydrolase)